MIRSTLFAIAMPSASACLAALVESQDVGSRGRLLTLTPAAA